MVKSYTIQAKVWLYPGKAAWHFVTIPPETSEDIDEFFSHVKRGWGSLPVTVTAGKTQWKTSIFPDKKSNSYLLPIKGEVRKQEGIQEGKSISFSIELTT